MDLSVVVPLNDEEENVDALHRAVARALGDTGLRYEILLVDDGSTDRTFEAARRVHAADPRVKVIRLRRNFGQTAAMSAGIERARGEVIVTMDGDLQNDPADIPRLLAAIREGCDVAAGWRHDRQDPFLRSIVSRIANRLVAAVIGVPLHDTGCSLKAYRASIIKDIPLYSDMHRFIPAMSSLAGSRIQEVKVSHHPRRAGRSKYGFSRIYKVLLDLVAIRCLLYAQRRPLAVFAGAALLAALLGVILAVAGLGAIPLPATRPSVVLGGTGVLYGALAIMLFFWGMLAELIYRTGDVRPERFASLTSREPRVPMSDD